MYKNLSNQSKEIIENNMNLRKTLSQVIPSDLVNHIIELITKDMAHENFLNLTK